MEFDYGSEPDERADLSGSASPGEPPEDHGGFGPSAASQLEASSPEHDEDYGGSGGAYGGLGGTYGGRASAGSSGRQSGWPSRGGSGGGAGQQQRQQQQEAAAAGGGQRQGRSTGEAGGGGGGAAQTQPGEYNAADFKNLDVTEDVRDLFKYIGRYRPVAVSPATPLKPFIPEYIPALGDIDEFIKVPRPDGKPDFLGLKVLDEPAAVQSDASVLALKLRQLGKGAAAGAGGALDVVGRVAHGADQAQRARSINAWVSSVTEIHKKRPATSVSYTTELPDIDALMQEFPPEVEAALRGAQLPGGDLDLDLPSYARLVCALLDVPVAGGAGGRPLLEALHHLFVLLLEFRANPFFRQALGEDVRPGTDGSGGGGGGGGGGVAAVGASAGASQQWAQHDRAALGSSRGLGTAGGRGSGVLQSAGSSPLRSR